MSERSLNELLRDLAAKGKLNHVTLSYGGTGKADGHRYTAGYRNQTSPGYSMHVSNDPVDALLTVLLNKGYDVRPGSKGDDEKKPRRNLLGE